MAQLSLNSYLQQVENAMSYKDGQILGELLSFKHPHIASPRLQLEKPEAQCEQWFKPPWDELIAAHLKCCWAVSNHDFQQAYSCQSLAVQAFTKIFQSQKDENWSLPVLFEVVVDLRRFANAAEEQLGVKRKGKTLEGAADTLMGCFRICASDRAAPEDSKKWGMLYLVNQFFKIYFKINKLHLCRPMIKAIDNLPIKDRFNISQLVTYRYYIGRKEMYDGNFRKAEEYLSFAFIRCHAASKHNKRMILIYLLPVKMSLGQMPKKSLLQKYDLMEFNDVAGAVSTGNLLQLTKALEMNEEFFIKCGIYLILEKLKTLTYRNLFKKVVYIMKTHMVPIPALTAAMKVMQVEDIDDDEVECILANLINMGVIKGYIAHQYKKLVVSKQKAFPKVTTILYVDT